MKKKLFFSVVIPTLNEVHYLPILLECLSKQQFRDFEVIVSDGNSTDGTAGIARTFVNNLPSLTVVESHEANVSKQRNVGAAAASGSYLVFIDADCSIGREFLKKIHAYILKDKSELMTTWLVPDSSDPVDEMLGVLTNFGIEIARKTKKPFLPGCNIIVKGSTFYLIGGFDEKLMYAEDHHFAYEARRRGIPLVVVEDAPLTFSLRRFRREGRLVLIQKYVRIIAHTLFKGPIYNKMFSYPMGGAIYAENNSSHSNSKGLLGKINKRLTKILR